MKKAIIIGASSGIGRALAITLSKNGYEVGLMARRTELLKTLQDEIATKTYTDYLDVTKYSEAAEKVNAMIKTMAGVDLIIINAGIGYGNIPLDWTKEIDTINVNVGGFTVMADIAFKYFAEQGHGHIVGISSIAALRGDDYAPAYGASKAYESHYMEGLRKKAFKIGKPIYITDIQPGYVDTDLVKGSKVFWMASAQKAAEQIYSAIVKRKKQAYITRRWRLFGWLSKIVPDWIYFRF